MALLLRGNIYHVRQQIGGVMIAKSTGTSNKKLAEAIEKKWSTEVHQEVFVAGRKPINVDKAMSEFLKLRRGMAGHDSCEIKLRLFKKWAKLPIHTVNVSEIEQHAWELVSSGKNAINTINVSLIYWNSIQNFCKRAGYTPGKKVSLFKGGNERIRFLSNAEQEKLLAQLHPYNGCFRYIPRAQDNYDYITILLHTGARKEEISQLKLEQINFEKGTITIYRSKGGTDTTMKMSKAVIDVIQKRIARSELPATESKPFGRVDATFVFPARADTNHYSNGWLERACERAEIKDCTLHTMRHTFATRMLHAGASLLQVQKLLGHKHYASTLRYAHLVEDETAAFAAAVLDA